MAITKLRKMKEADEIRYGKYIMYKRIGKLLPLIVMTFLAGCGKAGEETERLVKIESQTVVLNPSGMPEQLEESLSVTMKPSEQSEESPSVMLKPLDAEFDPDYTENKKSCIIQEDDDYIYVCGTFRLIKIDKATNESQVLWENAELAKERGLLQYAEGGGPSLYGEGSGLLLENQIYFIESWLEENDSREKKALSVINTDGTGYERKDLLESGKDAMLLQEGILYIDGGTVCYRMGEDGTFSERLEESANDFLQNDYRKATYYDNGYKTLFVQESLKLFGFLVCVKDIYLETEDDYVIMNPDTGEERKIIPDTKEQEQPYYILQAFNQDYLLMSSYKDGEHFCLVDVQSLEKTDLADYEHRVNVIAMDEEYLYIEDENLGEERQYTYEKVSLETGERSVIFTQEEINLGSSPWDLMDIVVQGGYIYYMGEKDYSLYLMRRSLAEPSKEEVLGDAVYDSGIGEVGIVKHYHEKVYSKIKSDRRLMEIDLEWLQVDERFPGAAKINEYLTEDQNPNGMKNAEWLEEMEEEVAREIEKEKNGEAVWHIYRSYSSKISGISYYDGQILSFRQLDYFYAGGAHGTAHLNGYTFDLQTGNRLKLANMIRNSEEELKEIAVKYFRELIEAGSRYFWEDALEVVRSDISFDSDFYLTEEGIGLYFNTYYLTNSIQEVLIPYEEFDMKISLK